MAQKTAGLLMFRRKDKCLQVLLAHPGGPYWTHKDQGAWSMPKGEYEDDEEPLQAAQREFQEETGFAVCEPYVALGTVKQPGGKMLISGDHEGTIKVESAGQGLGSTFTIALPRAVMQDAALVPSSLAAERG